MDFSAAIIAGVPIVLVALGLTQWIKSLGVPGKAVPVISMLIGLAMGIGYQVSLALPVDFAGWFGAAIYGLALGLVSSGIYDAIGDATKPPAVPPAAKGG